MNEMVRSSEVSGYFKQVNGATVYYSFPNDIETAFQRNEYDLRIGRNRTAIDKQCE